MSEQRKPTKSISYPIGNFFGGSVATDRLRRESNAQSGGLRYWRQAAPGQRAQNPDGVRALGSPVDTTDGHLPRVASTYNAAEHSTGMGLEKENFQSFVTGTHAKVVRIESAQTPETPPPVASPASPQLLARLQSAVFRYRSKASATGHDLPALPEVKQ